jgi:hypothetical protein
MAGTFEETYPSVARWVKTMGFIEIGYDDFSLSFVRALDIGGMIWEGGDSEDPLDTTLKTLDHALERWIDENIGER